jgi:anti-sigma B factor antagonist
MESKKSVVVKRIPQRMGLKQAREFLREVWPLLRSDRPQLVFDMSAVQHMDAAGVDVLLHCMREVMEHDGDLKLAAPSPQAAIVLELTRTGRLFEIYENTAGAVKSFSCFLPDSMKNLALPAGDNRLLADTHELGANNTMDDDLEGNRIAA